MSSFSREWATRAELERVDALVGEARARSGRAASTSAAPRARGGATVDAPWRGNLRYDVEAFEAWFMRRPLRVLARAVVVAYELGGVAARVSSGYHAVARAATRAAIATVGLC